MRKSALAAARKNAEEDSMLEEERVQISLTRGEAEECEEEE